MPPPVAVSVRDRTPEFLAIAERLQKQYGASTSNQNGIPSSLNTTKSLIQQHTEFSKKAGEIGHAIHRTSLKLQRLTQLARKASMFEDNAHEIDEMTGIIKQDIQGLNASISTLERISYQNSEGNKQSQDHSHTVVDTLRTRLKDATLEFKDVLTVRTEILKTNKERRGLFSSPAESEVTVPLLPKNHAAASPGLASFPGSGALVQATPSFMQQQQQQLVVANPQDTYLTSRAEALRNVESTIVELGTIFQKLSTMVAEQGELAIRIDENIDNTLSNVSNAQTHLLKYLNSISSNRWLILKVFLVLMAFLFIFIVFIV